MKIHFYRIRYLIRPDNRSYSLTYITYNPVRYKMFNRTIVKHLFNLDITNLKSI